MESNDQLKNELGEKSERPLLLNEKVLHSGVLAELGGQELKVLIALVCYMTEGEFPTQNQLAEKLGWSLQTMNKWLNSLLKFRWNGKPLVTRKMYYYECRPYPVYSIHPESPIQFPNY